MDVVLRITNAKYTVWTGPCQAWLLPSFSFKTLPAASTPSTSHTCLSIAIQDKPSGYACLTKLDIWGNTPRCQNARFYMDEFLERPSLFQSGAHLSRQTVPEMSLGNQRNLGTIHSRQSGCRLLVLDTKRI